MKLILCCIYRQNKCLPSLATNKTNREKIIPSKHFLEISPAFGWICSTGFRRGKLSKFLPKPCDEGPLVEEILAVVYHGHRNQCPSSKNPELSKVLSLKLGVDQNGVLHASPSDRNSAFNVHSTLFFAHSSSSIKCCMS